jgi:NAD(P)-dependent dehydrogenase (short-subunit alcohol dehydrogenase family)
MNRLDGKVALISGAARGIGAEAARLMAEAGAKVAIGDVLDEPGRQTALAIGGEALYTRLDVTSEADWSAAIAAVLGCFGGMDILVNNAGVFLGKSLEEASLADWHRLCAVNLTGVFLGTKLALPALRDGGARSPHGSAIVNLSSVAGIVGSSGDPLYSMTKGGVALFTKSAALEFARKGYRVRVDPPRHDRHRDGRSGRGDAGAQPRHQRSRRGAAPGAGTAAAGPPRHRHRHRQRHIVPGLGRCRLYDRRRSRRRWRDHGTVTRQ